MSDAPPERASTITNVLVGATPTDANAPAAIREEQVRSAVAFLSHPKVQASSPSSKRAFLERKGLTSAELAEAFNRVPEPGPTSAQQYAPAAPAAQQHQGQLMPTSSQPLVPYAGQDMPRQQAAGIRWTQVLLGASAVAAGAWAVKKLAGPYLSDLYHRLLPGSSEEADGQQGPTPEQAALAAASEELKRSVDALVEVARSLQQPVGGGSGGFDVAEEVRRELREFAGMLQRTTGGRAQASDTAELRREVEALKAALQEATRPGGAPQEPFRPAPTAVAQQWGSDRANGAASGALATASHLDYQARPFAPSISRPRVVPFGSDSRPAPTTYAPYSPSQAAQQHPPLLPQQPRSPPQSEAAAPSFGQPSRLPTPSTPPTTAPPYLSPQPQADAPQPPQPSSIPHNTGPVGGISYPSPSAVSDQAAGASSSVQAGASSAADVAQPPAEAAKVTLPDISMGWTGPDSESPFP